VFARLRQKKRSSFHVLRAPAHDFLVLRPRAPEQPRWPGEHVDNIVVVGVDVVDCEPVLLDKGGYLRVGQIVGAAFIDAAITASMIADHFRDSHFCLFASEGSSGAFRAFFDRLHPGQIQLCG
jgi:hypothetical protein